MNSFVYYEKQQKYLPEFVSSNEAGIIYGEDLRNLASEWLTMILIGLIGLT